MSRQDLPTPNLQLFSSSPKFATCANCKQKREEAEDGGGWRVGWPDHTSTSSDGIAHGMMDADMEGG